MSRSPSALGVLFRNEVRMLLRDTRTILIAVLAPLILFPMMAIILNAVENRDQERLEQAIFSWALVGDTADWARPLLERALANRSDSSLVGFLEQPATDPAAALAEGDLNLLVRAREVDGEPPSFVLEYRGRSDFSQAAAEAFRAVLSDAREDLRDSVFSAAGFPVARGEVAVVETQNVATQAQEAGAFLGLALTPFLILLMLGGGSIVAADAISGEKERGTLETLLTSAASRKEIVRAKLLAVVVVGLAVAVINVTNLLVYSTLGLIDLPSQLAVSVSLIELLGLLVLILPITVLVGCGAPAPFGPLEDLQGVSDLLLSGLPDLSGAFDGRVASRHGAAERDRVRPHRWQSASPFVTCCWVTWTCSLACSHWSRPPAPLCG